MAITYTMTGEDGRALARFVRRRCGSAVRLWIAAILGLATATLFYLYVFEGSVTVSAWLPFSEPQNRFARFALVLILPQITAVCLASGLHPILSCDTNREPVTMRVVPTEAGLAVRRGNESGAEEIIAWPKLSEAVRDDRYIYLMRTPVCGWIVPLAAFEHSGDAETFLDNLTFYWRRRHGHVRVTDFAATLVS